MPLINATGSSDSTQYYEVGTDGLVHYGPYAGHPPDFDIPGVVWIGPDGTYLNGPDAGEKESEGAANAPTYQEIQAIQAADYAAQEAKNSGLTIGDPFGIGKATSNIGKDIAANPLGALGLGIVAIPALPVLVIGGAGAVTILPAIEGLLGATDAIGITHSAQSGYNATLKDIIQHPAEVGQYSAEGELVIAGVAVGGPIGHLLSQFGLSGLQSGAQSAPTNAAPQQPQNILLSQLGIFFLLAFAVLLVIAVILAAIFL